MNPTEPNRPSLESRPRSLPHLVAFALSVPERLVRVVLGSLGALAQLVSFLVPKPVREGKFFQVAVARQINLLSDDLGQRGRAKGSLLLDGETAVRLGVGGAIDNLAVLTLHASPIWLLLAASDLGRGAHAFVSELVSEFRVRGLLGPESKFDSVDDVILGLAKLSERAADTLDLPPLSVEQLKASVTSMRQELTSVVDSAARVADVEDMAREIQELAKVGDRSLVDVTTTLATMALKKSGDLLQGTAATTTTTLRFLGRQFHTVFDDYSKSLRRVRRRGLAGALAFFSPMHSLRRLFSYAFLSWTEVGLSFGRWRRAPWRLA